MKSGQIIEAHHGVVRETFLQIFGECLSARGIADHRKSQGSGVLRVAAVGLCECGGSMLPSLGSVSVKSFPESCSGFATCLNLFFAGTIGRGGRLARELARGGELARVRGGTGLQVKHDVFFARFAGRP